MKNREPTVLRLHGEVHQMQLINILIGVRLVQMELLATVEGRGVQWAHSQGQFLSLIYTN